MFCHDCGSKAQENSVYCENCGAKLKKDYPQHNEQYSQQYQIPPANSYPTQHYQAPATNKKLIYSLLIASGILIVGLAIALILILRDDQPDNDRIDSNPVPTPVLTPEPVEESIMVDPVDEEPDQIIINEPEQAQNFLTAEQAREIAQAWLINYPIGSQRILDNQNYTEMYNGIEYFRFFLIEPSFYWFSILVHKETGDLYCMLIEDGMDPAPPHVEPLDIWYSNAFDPDIDLMADLYQATQDQYSHINLLIAWDNGENTVFIREGDTDWFMYSRDGSSREVYPEFTLRRDVIEIRFPTTRRVYSLYDDFVGTFGDESFRWGYMIS